MWLLHGHVHDKWRQQGRLVNVGVVIWDFTPVAEEAIARLMDGTLRASASLARTSWQRHL